MPRTMFGEVVSDKADKTVVVSVASVKEHPIYRKKYTETRKYHAHDSANHYHVGDLVEIKEARPMSRLKRWEVTRKVTTTELEG